MLNRSRNVLRLMLRSSPDDHEVLRNAVLMAAIEQTGRRPVRSAPVGIPALTSPDAGASQVGGRRHVRECRAWKARNAPIGTSSSPSSVAITRTGTPGPAGTPRSPARTAAAGRPGRDPEAGREQFDQQQQGEEGHHAANAWSCAVMTPAPRHGRPLGWSRPSRGRTPHRRPRRSGSTFIPVGGSGSRCRSRRRDGAHVRQIPPICWIPLAPMLHRSERVETAQTPGHRPCAGERTGEPVHGPPPADPQPPGAPGRLSVVWLDTGPRRPHADPLLTVAPCRVCRLSAGVRSGTARTVRPPRECLPSCVAAAVGRPRATQHHGPAGAELGEELTRDHTCLGGDRDPIVGLFVRPPEHSRTGGLDTGWFASMTRGVP